MVKEEEGCQFQFEMTGRKAKRMLHAMSRIYGVDNPLLSTKPCSDFTQKFIEVHVTQLKTLTIKIAMDLG